MQEADGKDFRMCLCSRCTRSPGIRFCSRCRGSNKPRFRGPLVLGTYRGAPLTGTKGGAPATPVTRQLGRCRDFQRLLATYRQPTAPVQFAAQQRALATLATLASSPRLPGSRSHTVQQIEAALPPNNIAASSSASPLILFGPSPVKIFRRWQACSSQLVPSRRPFVTVVALVHSPIVRFFVLPAALACTTLI